jgi:hypothetical protein
MIALIHLLPEIGTRGMLSVGGRPLLARQLDWLFSLRFQRVLVELDSDAPSRGVGDWLHDTGALRQRDGRVTIVTSEDRPGARAIAGRAGVPGSRSLLAIPADFLGDGDLGALFPASNAFGLVAFFAPPRALCALSGGTVRIVRAPLAGGQRPVIAQGQGWGVRLKSAAEANALWAASADGKLPGRRVAVALKAGPDAAAA